MTSQIDPTVPILGTPTTASVRQNFLIAHNEITALQQGIGGGGQEGFTVGVVTGGVATYTVIPPINYVSVRQMAPALAVILPNGPVTGYSVMVKDTLGNSGANNISVQSSTALIDGASTFTLHVGYSAFRFTFDGTSWGVSG